MRVPTIACVLLAVSTPALAADGLVVSKKVTSLEKTDKALTSIMVLTAVPDVLKCFHEPVEVDVDLDSDGKTVLVTTDRSDKARASCLEAAFKKMKVKTKSAFKARIHLVAKEDPRKKKQADDAKTEAILENLDSSASLGMISSPGAGPASSAGTGTGTGTSNVSVGSPDGSYGDYTADEIGRVVKAHAGAMRACYQMQLEKEPKLSGKLTYEIQIGTDGAVSKVRLKSSTAKSKKLDECLTNQLKKLKFPAKGSTATVTYPFVFVQQT